MGDGRFCASGMLMVVGVIVMGFAYTCARSWP